MAIQIIEGFDHLQDYRNKNWSRVDGGYGGNMVAAPGRFNNRSVALYSGYYPTYLTKYFTSSYSSIVFGVAVGVLNNASQDFFRIVDADGNYIARFGFNGANHKYIVYNAYNTTIATSDALLLNGSWHYLEAKITIGSSNGALTTYVDGTQDIVVTDKNFGTTNIGGIQLMSTASDNPVYFDDLYALDTSGPAPWNDFLGDCRVETLVPTDAGNSTNWTPNTGANYAAVDEMSGTYHDSDTTYVESDTVNQIDTYTLGNLSTTTGRIYAVQTNLVAKKTDAGLRQIAPVIRYSGLDYSGSTATLATDYLAYSQIWQQDPTSSNWSVSKVNNIEVGQKVIT